MSNLPGDFKQTKIDLAAERTGGETLDCSDDFFAPMENLLKPGRGTFIEDKYTDRGKWMDGWESRRSYGRDNGREFDWCTIRLGMPGIIKSFDIDTNHFRGNAPLSVSVEACVRQDTPDDTWQMLLPPTQIRADSQNLFEIDNPQTWTYLRLRIFPDGGIARFRVYGEVTLDLKQLSSGELLNLAAIENGARAVMCSDMFFGSVNNLLLPGSGINMGDGWETRRRRDPGPDWVIIKLAVEGHISKVVIDTAHFKGNYPDRFSLEGAIGDDRSVTNDGVKWQDIIVEAKLLPDSEHLFVEDIVSGPEKTFTHVRLKIFPDGGISRLRLFGYRKKYRYGN